MTCSDENIYFPIAKKKNFFKKKSIIFYNKLFSLWSRYNLYTTNEKLSLTEKVIAPHAIHKY